MKFNIKITPNNITNIVQDELAKETNTAMRFILSEFLEYQFDYTVLPITLTKIVFQYIFKENKTIALNSFLVRTPPTTKLLTIHNLQQLLSYNLIDLNEDAHPFVSILTDEYETINTQLLKDCCHYFNADYQYLIDCLECYKFQQYKTKNAMCNT